LADVQQHVGTAGHVTALSLDVPVDQAFVDVTAKATSTEAARIAADRAAQILVDRSTAQSAADAEQRKESASAQLDAIDKNVAALSDQLTAVSQRMSELQVANNVPNPSAQNLTEFRLAENQRSDLLQRRSAELQRRSVFSDAYDRAVLDLSTLKPDV